MSRSRLILNESWGLLTESQQNVVVYSERRLVPLLEQLSVLFENKLTQDQIESIFGAAEQVATDAGGNRTGIGKAKDIAGLPVKVTKQIDAAIKDVAKKAQDTTPVKNFDAQFEKLKQKIIEKVGGEDAKIVQMLKQYGQWAKDNPGKSMLILALLSAAASLTVGGGAAAAAVGFMFKTGNKLIQGEKLSSALGSGLYGAAIGYLSGMAFRWLSDTIIDNIAMGKEAELMNQLKSMDQSAKDAAMSQVAKDFPGMDLKNLGETGRYQIQGYINKFNYNYDVIITPDQTAQINALKDVMSNNDTFSKDYYQAAGKFHEYMANIQSNTEQQSILKAARESLMAAKEAGASYEQMMSLDTSLTSLDSVYDAAKNISADAAAAVQGAVSQVEKSKQNMHQAEPVSDEEKSTDGGGPQTESRYLYHKNRDLELIYEQIAQEGMLDSIKNIGKQAGSAIAGGISKGAAAVGQAGKNLTTKVTKDKLMKTWAKSGSPTDMGSIVNIMQDAGVTPDMLQSIQDQTQIKLPGMAGQPTPQASPEQPTPQAPVSQGEPSQQFKYTGSNKKVSGVMDKINAGGLTRDQILKYLQSKKQA